MNAMPTQRSYVTASRRITLGDAEGRRAVKEHISPHYTGLYWRKGADNV
jgi:hypothetical protein